MEARKRDAYSGWIRSIYHRLQYTVIRMGNSVLYRYLLPGINRQRAGQRFGAFCFPANPRLTVSDCSFSYGYGRKIAVLC